MSLYGHCDVSAVNAPLPWCRANFMAESRQNIHTANIVDHRIAYDGNTVSIIDDDFKHTVEERRWERGSDGKKIVWYTTAQLNRDIFTDCTCRDLFSKNNILIRFKSSDINHSDTGRTATNCIFYTDILQRVVKYGLCNGK